MATRSVSPLIDILLMMNVQDPALAVYLPARRQEGGQALVICPGRAVAGCANSPKGGHGYSFAVGRGYLQTRTDRLYDWLSFLNKAL